MEGRGCWAWRSMEPLFSCFLRRRLVPILWRRACAARPDGAGLAGFMCGFCTCAAACTRRRVSGSGAMAASGPLCRQAWLPKHLIYGFWLCADCSVTGRARRANPAHFIILYYDDLGLGSGALHMCGGARLASRAQNFVCANGAGSVHGVPAGLLACSRPSVALTCWPGCFAGTSACPPLPFYGSLVLCSFHWLRAAVPVFWPALVGEIASTPLGASAVCLLARGEREHEHPACGR